MLADDEIVQPTPDSASLSLMQLRKKPLMGGIPKLKPGEIRAVARRVNRHGDLSLGDHGTSRYWADLVANGFKSLSARLEVLRAFPERPLKERAGSPLPPRARDDVGGPSC
jgi:hypothetical protein